MPREKTAQPFGGSAFQPYHVEDLADAAPADPIASRDRPQVVPRGAATVRGACVQQCPDLVQWAAQPGEGLPVDGRPPRGGGIQAEDDAHGGGLAESWTLTFLWGWLVHGCLLPGTPVRGPPTEHAMVPATGRAAGPERMGAAPRAVARVYLRRRPHKPCQGIGTP